MDTPERRDPSKRLREGFLASVLESQPDPVVTIDEECTIRYITEDAADLIGLEPVDMIGRPLLSLAAPGLSMDRARDIRKRFSADRPVDDSISFPMVIDGTERRVSFAPSRHVHRGETFHSGPLRTEDRTDTTSGATDNVATRGATDDVTGSVEDTRSMLADPSVGGRSGGNGEDVTPVEPIESSSDLSGVYDGTDFGSADAFRRIVEHAGHAIYITDTDGRIEYVNGAFTETTGYESEEIVGRNASVLSSGEMSAEYFRRLWETIESGEVWTEAIVDQRKNGEPYHAMQTIAPVFDGDDIVRYVAIQTDITRRKRTEERLRKYRNIVELLEDPIMLQDLDGKFELTNEAVAEYAGHSREELHGTDEASFMDETTATRIEQRKRAVLDAEESQTYGVSPTFVDTDETASFRTTRYPYYNGDGELVGTVAICRDVTDLERRTEELKRYERAITGATDLIAAVDADGRYLFMNPRYAEFHSLDPEAAKGERIEAALSDEAMAELAPRLDRARRGETVNCRLTRHHPTKGERTLDAQYYPLDGASTDGSVADGVDGSAADGITDDGNGVGGRGGVVAVLRDITDRENRSRQLRVVDRVLQHNIRNDLTLIRGHADTIRLEGSAGVARSADVILEYADDLLTTSEKSRAVTEILSEPPQQQPLDIADVVDTVARSTIEEYPNARIERDLPSTATAVATPDVDRAIGELVRNAIEHSDRATPNVSIDVDAREDRVLVRVTDDGPGISEMDRDVVETGTATEALYHGSGLGLWMVYWICRRSGGTITVGDAEPRGTRVTMSLPMDDDSDRIGRTVDDWHAAEE